MPRKSSLWSNSFIGVSLGLFLLSIYWPDLYQYIKKSNSMAFVISSRGTTEWISRKGQIRPSAKKQSSLVMNESLMTGIDGEVVLRFKRGAEIRVLPSSFVTIIKKAQSTLLSIRKGEIEVLKEGEEGSLLVAQNGVERRVENYQAPISQKPLWIDPSSLDSIKSIETLPSESSTSQLSTNELNLDEGLKYSGTPLSPITEKQSKDIQSKIRQMITERIGNQKNHLFRCYSSLVQKDKSAQGRLELHFAVNNRGKVEDPLIANSEIKNKTFEKCLLQIVKRIEFLPFQGEKVSTYLPLRFEKNLE